MTLPMSRPVRFRLLEDGRWSGGGSVLLENAREARERHPVLQGDSDAVPIMARNVPPMGKIPSQPFVLAPQNAWVWTPVATGLKERALVTGLRAGTWAMYRRAGAFIRISEAVPPGTTGPTSKVLHNVLDRGFETASAQQFSRELFDAGVFAMALSCASAPVIPSGTWRCWCVRTPPIRLAVAPGGWC